VNPFTRRYSVKQIAQVKMFVRPLLCAHVKAHGCDDAVEGAFPSMNPRKVRYRVVRCSHCDCDRGRSCSLCA
jgi:hypothetical protein